MGFDLALDLAEREAQRSLRVCRTLTGPQGVRVTREGRGLLNFCSNDYLGMASHPALAEAMADGARRWGVGAGAAHLVCGHSEPHTLLEQALAEFTGRQRALLFSSGYMANMGVIAGLLGAGDTLYQDRLNHASLLDGGRLSGARQHRFRHADLADLQQLLAHTARGRRLIVTDGVFSMDGDIACLRELSDLARQNNAWLMVDDAHGLGVLGDAGGGAIEMAGLDADEVPVLVGTLGKAFGTSGAFVAGSDELIQYLIQHARSYVYTTAMSPALAEATRASIGIVKQESWRRQALTQRIQQFRSEAAMLQLPLLPSKTAIQGLVLGDNARALEASAWLAEAGFWVSAIRPPTVPAGTARLRITLSAMHQPDEVSALLRAVRAYMDTLSHES